jgi:hypothetical protein
MKPNLLLIISGVVGIVCGLVSHTPFLNGQWLNLVVWGIVGIALGLFMSGTRLIIWAGLVYGFCLSVTFLISGFQGNADKLPAFLLLTLVLSLVGALGGLATVFVGSRLRRLLHLA